MIYSKKYCLPFLNFYFKLLLFVACFFSINNHINAANSREPKLSVAETAISKKTGVKEVLAPEKFSGRIAEGYSAAQKARDICSKLFCYCGCDLTDEHLSLLDCFTCMHGVDCAICQEEAIIALHMKEQGKPLGLIQETIDEKFAAQYPWDEPSLALQRYLKSIKVYRRNPHTKSSTIAGKTSHKKKQGHCCGH